MSKTIKEIQKNKKTLEKRIAKMLLDFEQENELEISGCYYESDEIYEIVDNDFTPPYRECKKTADFEIKVVL